MSVGTAAIFKAIAAVWSTASLDSKFNTYWDATNRTEFSVLNETEAEGSHPFPYCVFEVPPPRTTGRSTGLTADTGREAREVMCYFRVHTRDMDGAESAKEIAAKLAEEVMKVFGGHPTSKNLLDGYALDYGNIIVAQYQTDYDLREDIENWQWCVQYKLMTDVPVQL